LQSFANFFGDCPAVRVVNINEVAHDGTPVPVNPARHIEGIPVNRRRSTEPRIHIRAAHAKTKAEITTLSYPRERLP
jgi:hypothetical protein